MKSDAEVLNQLRTLLNNLAGLSQADWVAVAPLLQVVRVSERELLQTAGDTNLHYYFVASGLVRVFYTTPEGKEYNKGFYSQNNIVGSISARILREASIFSIETLEPCVLIKLPLDDIKESLKSSGAWQRLLIYTYERVIVRKYKREDELMTMSPKLRFQQFVLDYPDLFQRVPQYHIASYLGITPAALSRYKKRWLDELQ